MPRETLKMFCERTGREFIPMGEDETTERMRNVNAWYRESETKGLITYG